MKYTKKLFALTVALILALALAAPTFAQSVETTLGGTGTITITNATVGQTYGISKVFDASYTGDDNAAYSIQKEIGGETNPWYTIVAGKIDMFTLKQSTADPNVYVVSFVEGVTGEAVRDFLAGQSFTADASAEATEANVQFTNVAYGYYLVSSSLGNGVVTVTNAKPNATVIDKNQEPIPGDEFKSATDTTVQIGETTTFTVRFTTTNYDGETMITHYDVKDTMADTMQMVEGSLVVKVGGKVLVKDTDYTGTVDENGFDIDIKWYDNATKAFLYTSPNTLTITYDAKLLAGATVAGEGNVNNAEIGYNGTTEKTDTEKLYTYALAIQKVDKAGNGLEGAKFTLMNGSTPVTVSGSNGVYTVDPNGSAEIVSPEDGLIVIKGVDNDEYTLTETAAPEGYNLLTESLKVTPTATTETSTDITKYLDENGNVSDVDTGIPVTIKLADVAATPVVVVNFTGTELPSTGGIGTTIFYTLGGLLVVGAAVLLVTKKRVHDMEA